MTLAESTILITGASQGLGRRLAIHFAPKCRRIYLTARNRSNLETVAGEVEAAGGNAVAYPSDLRDPNSLIALRDAVQEDGNGLDLLINNAADVTSKPLSETSLDEIENLIRTNVTGTLQLTALLLPLLVERSPSAVVNISSLAGYKADPTQTVYSVSKSGVNAISDALRAELKGCGVQVMNVALPGIDLNGNPAPGQIAFERFALALESGLRRGTDELFLSPVTRWLMRLYRFYPPLAKLR